MSRDPLKQRLDALAVRLQEVGAFRDVREWPTGAWTASAEGHTPVTVREGDPWPFKAYPTTFACAVTVPSDAHGHPVDLVARVGGEGLLIVDGTARGGLNPYHDRVRLTDRADGTSTYDVVIEAVAHGLFGHVARRPHLDALRLVRPDATVVDVHEDLLAVHDLARALAARGRARLGWAYADLLFEVVSTLDVPRAPTDRYLARMKNGFATNATGTRSSLSDAWEGWSFEARPVELSEVQRRSWRAAHERFQAGLDDLRASFAREGRLVAIPHAHIDYAWLWPIAETKRKARRTFATALETLRRDPSATFAQSMAQLYADVRDADPALWDEIRTRVHEGRWEVLGGMWVEPDGNLPSGEAWVRQLLHGQRWFEEHLGVTSKVGWLPDTFGYCGNLPQLLRLAGMDGFFTTKLVWNDTDDPARDVYRWVGIDGSDVVAHVIRNPLGGYNGLVEAEGLLSTWENVSDVRAHDAALYVFGHGDGGGGPDDAMNLRLPRLRNLPGLPTVERGRVDEFFAGIDRSKLPTWHGEQYLELHRGTYTSQARIKVANRRLEHALVDAEAAATLDGAGAGPRDEGRAQALREAWTILLRNQFHDILPGSSVHTVNVEAEAEMHAALERVEAIRDGALQRLAGSIEGSADDAAAGGSTVAVFNLQACSRLLRGVLPRPLDVPFELRLPSGDVVPWQAVDDGIYVDHPAASVPGIGVLALRAVPVDDSPAVLDPSSGMLDVSPTVLSNDLVRYRVGADGSITDAEDLRTGAAFLSAPANVLLAHADLPRFYEAWELDPDDAAAGRPLALLEPVEVVERGPLRASLRIVRGCDGIRVEQHLRLSRHSARLDVQTRIDVFGRRTQVRALFPLAVHASEATFETAFGAVTRPTHRNVSWDQAKFEVPAHRWADLSQPGRGVALLNDGRYGHAVLEGTLSLNLVRSPMFPDPFADEGEHAFTYALLPHAGDWRAGVVDEAHDLNAPLRGTVVRASQSSSQPSLPSTPREHSFVSVDVRPHAGIRLAALKPAHDGRGVVVRLYEAHGGDGESVGVVTAGEALGWVSRGEVDLLERPISEPRAWGPYVVRSWSFDRT